MPIQNLSDAFTELEKEVKSLEQRKTSVTQDISTLEARKAFLERSTKEAETKRVETENQVNKAINDLQLQLTNIRSDVKTETDKVVNIIQKQHVLTTNLETMQVTTDQEVEKLNNKLQAKKIELTTIKDDIQAENHNLEVVKGEVAAKLLRLSSLDDELAQKQHDVGIKLGELDTEQKTAQDNINVIKQTLSDTHDKQEIIESKVAAARIELLELQRKQIIYVYYESRAQAALEAKETALLDRENALTDAEIRAKRRGILDNI